MTKGRAFEKRKAIRLNMMKEGALLTKYWVFDYVQ